MKKLKLLPIIALAIALCLAFAGCGASQDGSLNKAPETEKQIEAEKPDEKANDQENQPAAELKEAPANETAKELDEIRPELKEFLDSYEAFMDEYVEFMKNYKTSDLSMLSKYSELLTKYAEFAQKADEWEGKELNNKELIYYTEVLGRVSQKLLQVSVGN